jgi:hypothetical protein
LKREERERIVYLLETAADASEVHAEAVRGIAHALWAEGARPPTESSAEAPRSTTLKQKLKTVMPVYTGTDGMTIAEAEQRVVAMGHRTRSLDPTNLQRQIARVLSTDGDFIRLRRGVYSLARGVV